MKKCFSSGVQDEFQYAMHGHDSSKVNATPRCPQEVSLHRWSGDGERGEDLPVVADELVAGELRGFLVSLVGRRNGNEALVEGPARILSSSWTPRDYAGMGHGSVRACGIE